jgi:hypothetical protein
VGKVPEMEGVIDFLVARIRAGKEVQEIKCMRVVLHALVRVVGQFAHVYTEMCARNVLLAIEVQRLFDKLWKKLFGDSLSNSIRLAQRN